MGRMSFFGACLIADCPWSVCRDGWLLTPVIFIEVCTTQEISDLNCTVRFPYQAVLLFLMILSRVSDPLKVYSKSAKEAHPLLKPTAEIVNMHIPTEIDINVDPEVFV